jgi:hypothetical protein
MQRKQIDSQQVDLTPNASVICEIINQYYLNWRALKRKRADAYSAKMEIKFFLQSYFDATLPNDEPEKSFIRHMVEKNLMPKYLSVQMAETLLAGKPTLADRELALQKIFENDNFLLGKMTDLMNANQELTVFAAREELLRISNGLGQRLLIDDSVYTNALTQIASRKITQGEKDYAFQDLRINVVNKLVTEHYFAPADAFILVRQSMGHEMEEILAQTASSSTVEALLDHILSRNSNVTHTHDLHNFGLSYPINIANNQTSFSTPQPLSIANNANINSSNTELGATIVVMGAVGYALYKSASSAYSFWFKAKKPHSDADLQNTDEGLNLISKKI